jgi:hypothetical protein
MAALPALEGQSRRESMPAGICVVETFIVAMDKWAYRIVWVDLRPAPGEMIESFNFVETSLLANRSAYGEMPRGHAALRSRF